MADGQHAFGFHPLPTSRLRPGEIVVDLFAGGGGASTALEQALQRPVDIAINHDRFAVGMHAANHPLTRHLREDVWVANPRELVGDRRVGWLHASPDCTHFSQAKGGQPRSRATRSLSWVVLKWAGAVRPRIISLENVTQIQKWGPLVAKRDAATGRVLKLDGSIAAPGERVPVGEQFLIPDKRHAGRTWRNFIAALRGLGYAVEWRALRACDYGAGTSRTRLFLIARRDGEPIQWPEPTHGPQWEPFVTAADCIDWSIPCPSIFERKKPLADATCRRIARGIKRYVIDAAKPFIVGDEYGPSGSPGAFPESVAGGGVDRRASACDEALRSARVHEEQAWPGAGESAIHRTHGPIRTGNSAPVAAHADARAPFLTEHANASRQASWSANDPLRTQCANVKGGHFALAAATLVQAAHGEGNGATKRRGSGAHDVQQPVGTVPAGGNSFALASATLVQTGYGERDGQAPRALDLQQPLGTVVGGASKHALVTAFLEQANGGGPNGNPARARDAREPLSAITGTGSQQRVVTCTLSPDVEAGALRVAAFLATYYGNGDAVSLRDPLDTVTTRDRLALVTVTIRGTPYVIVDIGLRMLKPHELYRAQGFPAEYTIDRTADGTPMTISQQVRMVGNSVSPPPLCALATANLDAVIPRAVAA